METILAIITQKEDIVLEGRGPIFFVQDGENRSA